MQNVRDYVEVKLHTTAKSVLKAIAKPTFKSYTILAENLVQTNHFTQTVLHNMPIAIGVSILELVSIINFNFNKMYLRNGKHYSLNDEYWFKYTKDAKTTINLTKRVKKLRTDGFYNEYSVSDYILNCHTPFYNWKRTDKDHVKYNSFNTSPKNKNYVYEYFDNKEKFGYITAEKCSDFVTMT